MVFNWEATKFSVVLCSNVLTSLVCCDYICSHVLMCLSHISSVKDESCNSLCEFNMVSLLYFTQVLVTQVLVEYDKILKVYLHVNSDL